MIIPKLSKEFILSRISEIEIFKKYLEITPNLSDKFTNKLRDDTLADCSFYVAKHTGQLRFKDFAYGFNWSCYDVVMFKYGINFYDALLQIALDFGVINGENSNQPNTHISFVLSGVSLTPKQIHKLEIGVKKRRYEQIDLDYWSKYSLEPKDLYYVYPIQKLWINNNVTYIFKPIDIAYSYHFGNSDYKIYFPLRDKYRFIQNGNHMQGERLLPDTGELLIITKSYKDVLLLIKMGYNAVAPASENSYLSDNKIVEYRLRFKSIVLMFDNDASGKFATKYYSEKFNLPFIFVPDNYPKDISDFVHQEGYENSLDLMDYLLNQTKMESNKAYELPEEELSTATSEKPKIEYQKTEKPKTNENIQP